MSDNPSPTQAANARTVRGLIQISIDPNSKTAVITSSREIGNAIKTEVERGSREAVKALDTNLNQMRNSFKEAAKDFATVFAIGKIVQTTNSMKQLNLMFTALAGSEAEAAKQLQELRALADKTHQPFVELAKSGQALLPALRGSNASLAQAVSLAQRLSVLDPVQGFEGAAIAIKELLSGDYISLARRFEISRGELQKLLAAAGDDPVKILAGLDALVNKMGLTEDAIAKMGDEGVFAFQEMQSAATEAVALAFTPFLNDFVIPAIRGVTELLEEVRQLDPELLRIASTLAGIALTMQAISRVPGLGTLGTGSAGAAVAGTFIGAEAGTAIARAGAQSGIIDNEALAQAESQREAQAVLLDTFKMGVLAAADTIASFVGIVGLGTMYIENGVNKFALSIEEDVAQVKLWWGELGNAIADIINTIIEMNAHVQDSFGTMIQGIGDFVDSIPGLDDMGLKDLGKSLRVDFANIPKAMKQDLTPLRDTLAQIQKDYGAAPLKPTESQVSSFMSSFDQFRQDFVGGLHEMLFPAEEVVESVSSNIEESAAHVDKFTEEQLDAWEEYNKDLEQIQADAAQERLDAEAENERKRTELIRDQGRERDQAIREEGQRQAKDARKFRFDISKTAQDGYQAEVKIIRDTDREIEKIRAEKFDADVEAEQAHKDKLAEIQRQSRADIQEAAAKFDAAAVEKIQAATAEKERELQTQYDAEKKAREDDRAARIAEVEAERIQKINDLRSEIATRLEEMRTRFLFEQGEDAIQFQQKMEKMAGKHAEEMRQLDTNLQERLTKIDQNADRETEKLTQKFIETYNKLAEDAGQHQNRMIGIQRAGLAQMERDFTAWILNQQKKLGQSPNIISPASRPQPTYSPVQRTFARPSFSVGADIMSTDLYQLEKGEQVLPAHVANFMRHMMGGRELTAPSVMGAMGGGSRSMQSAMTNNFYDVGKYSPDELRTLVADTIDQRLIEILTEYSGG